MPGIPHDKYSRIIRTLDFGGSTAEQDKLLSQARIETSAFSELYLGRIDIVRGCKGSGKTALFRLFNETLRDKFLEERKISFINAAEEPNGDPIFQLYANRFAMFSENEFQNFWRVYFIYLLNEHIFQSSRYSEILRVAKSEIKAFEKECTLAGIPILKVQHL